MGRQRKGPQIAVDLLRYLDMKTIEYVYILTPRSSTGCPGPLGGLHCHCRGAAELKDL